VVPLALGLAIRHRRPALAERLQGPAGLLSKLLNLAVIALILATQWHTLAAIRPRGFLGMFLLLSASLICGWLLGGMAKDGRRAVTLTTAVRNSGVSLVIVTAAFPGTPAVTAVLAYGLCGLLGSLALALVWGRLGPMKLAET